MEVVLSFSAVVLSSALATILIDVTQMTNAKSSDSIFFIRDFNFLAPLFTADSVRDLPHMMMLNRLL